MAGVTAILDEFEIQAAAVELPMDSNGGGGTHSIGEAQSVP